MKFLDESTALDTIGKILEDSSKAKMAVAFWGDGALRKLGIPRPGLLIEAICNLESGSCNPFEIRKLRDASGISLKTHKRLHAKVYWTPSAAVLGSSNASSNGLAVEGQEVLSWAEANLLVDRPKLLAELSIWFDRLFGEGREISDRDLELAEERWARRPCGGPAAILTDDLMTAYRADPQNRAWARVKVGFITEPLSGAALGEYKATKEDPAFRRHFAWQGWHDEIDPGDWLIEFEDFNGSDFRFAGFYLSPTPKLESKRLTWLAWHQRLMLDAFPGLGLDRRTQNRIKRLAAEVTSVRGQECLILPLAHVIQRLDASIH